MFRRHPCHGHGHGHAHGHADTDADTESDADVQAEEPTINPSAMADEFADKFGEVSEAVRNSAKDFMTNHAVVQKYTLWKDNGEQNVMPRDIPQLQKLDANHGGCGGIEYVDKVMKQRMDEKKRMNEAQDELTNE